MSDEFARRIGLDPDFVHSDTIWIMIYVKLTLATMPIHPSTWAGRGQGPTNGPGVKREEGMTVSIVSRI